MHVRRVRPLLPCNPWPNQELLAGATAAAGCDVSHRGGQPGFVQVAAGGATLRWADYTGNDFFNTLGACYECHASVCRCTSAICTVCWSVCIDPC